MHTFRILWSLPLAALATLSPSLRAQGADPMREIQEIARRVDEQLQEIDRLLLESGRKGQSRSKPKEMLQQAREHSVTVEDGIDKLIEKLNEMKQKGGGGGSSQDQQNQDQDQNQDQPTDGQSPRQQQNQRNRRENQTPEFQPRQEGKQQGEEPGQQPGQDPQGQGKQQQQQPKPGGGEQQPSGGDTKGGQENPDGGANTRGNRQHEPETGPGTAGTGDGSWGDLQPYMNFLRNRGSQPPAVPEKFRKYWEAYLKQKQGGGGTGGGK